jgi:hypothetical protein
MRWRTLAHLHLDRVASAWLVVRFVDKDAEFEYLDWDTEHPDDADGKLFGMPGIELSSHDERGTCFSKILRAYKLDDPALALLERVVAAGVAHALSHESERDLEPDLQAVGVALDLLGIGFGVTADDAEHLRHAMPLYDALFCVCRTHTLPDEVRDQIPPLPGDRTAFLREALAIT